MIEDWSDLDVTEARGKRPKSWVRGPNDLWLRKEPRDWRPTEPAIEALMLRLARAVEVPAPEAHACCWREPLGGTKHGIVVRLFNEPGEELSLGSVELRALDPAYDPEQKKLHTLARVRKALAALESQAGVPMLVPFARMLAFDAWIGNSDRHQENWGVMRVAGAPRRLAPLFDPAACLGVELDDGDAQLEPTAELDRYVTRCRSGFGDGIRERPLLTQEQVVSELAAYWPEWNAGISCWVAAFDSSMDTLERVVTRVSAVWLPPRRAAFACRLLHTRLEWLRRMCGR